MKCKKIISCLVACSIIFGSSVVAFADAKSDQLYAAAYQSVSRAKESLSQSSINIARRDVNKLKGTEAEDKIEKLTKELDKVQNEVFNKIIEIIKNDNRTQRDLDDAFYYLKAMKDTPELAQYYNEWQGMINNIQEASIKECKDMLNSLKKKSDEKTRVKVRDCLLDLTKMNARSDIENLYFCQIGELKDEYIDMFGKDKLYGREEFIIVNSTKDNNSLTITFNRKFPDSLINFPFGISLLNKEGRTGGYGLDRQNFKIERKDKYTMIVTPNDKTILKTVTGVKVYMIERFQGNSFNDYKDFDYKTDFYFNK